MNAGDAALAGDGWAELTLPRLFLGHVARRPDAPALRWRDGAQLAHLTWSQYADRASRVAGALRSLGLRRGDRVVMLNRNVPDFHVAEVGIQLAGLAGVGIYGTSAPDQIRYQAAHCGARAAIVEAGPMLERFLAIRAELPELEHLIVLGDRDTATPDAVPFAELVAHEPDDLERLVDAAQPGDLVNLVYTSGTTGAPKGVIYTQQQLVWVARCIRNAVGESLDGWEWLSYMPLAHVGERVTGHYNHLAQGTTSTSCPDFDAVTEMLPLVRPTIFLAVPRVWEKLSGAMRAAAGPDGGWAFDAGVAAERLRLSGEPVPPEAAEAAAKAESQVLHDVRAAVGLDGCRVALIGGAGLDPSLMMWLRGAGINVAEGYGLTESGLLTWDPWQPRPGTVGRALPGIEIRLAEDGEILFRGRDGVPTFVGYFREPERTAEAIGEDGWVATGDLGALDADGYLSIVGRKKEILVTSGGKNVAPVPLELGLKADPLILDACVIGDGRRYVTGLVCLDRRELAARGLPTDLAVAASDPAVLDHVGHVVEAVNSSVSRAESIRRFAVVADEWLPGTALITPTGKLRRDAIAARYAEEIDALYAGDAATQT